MTSYSTIVGKQIKGLIMTDMEKLTRTLTEIGCQFEFNENHDIDIYTIETGTNNVTGALFKFNDDSSFMKVEFYTLS